MNSWFVWGAFALAALVLGLVGCYFSLRVLRVAAALVTLAAVAYLTWYGLTHPANGPGSLSDAFTRGANALAIALFHPLPVPVGHHIPAPGRIGWIVIAALLVIGYRELEAWSLHCHARSLDTSALVPVRQNAQDDPPSDRDDALTDVQRHDRLAEELKFRLPAAEVRSPPILPGGSRPSELASIAEASGVTGSGLAGAIIRFVGMLWPSPRRVRVRVWVERAAGEAKLSDVTRVTVNLDGPPTGTSIATSTLTAGCLDDAASAVAGYVARYIFAEDPTAPPWCTGAADGSDLAALLLAKQVHAYPGSAQRINTARSAKIRLLESAAGRNLCAGVVRYELAHLYDLEGRHVEALLLHARNREQYPRFWRGRYRLAMSLEMIANLDFGRRITKDEVPKLDEALKILHGCCEKLPDKNKLPDKSDAHHVGYDKFELSAELRCLLLEVAWNELQAIRKYLTLPNVIWKSFWHRDERGILKPYWQLRHRQEFHDGACVALLLVAVRQACNGQEETGSAQTSGPEGYVVPRIARRLPRARVVRRIATAAANDKVTIAAALDRSVQWHEEQDQDQEWEQPMDKRLRTRHRPGQCSTRSWQAAYNLACVYAAIAQDRYHQLEARKRQADDPKAVAEAEAEGIKRLVAKVVTSLDFAFNNRECELERPSEWISHDPDLGFLRSSHKEFAKGFADFFEAQQRRDYPRPTGIPQRTAAASQSLRHDLDSTQAASTRAVRRWLNERHLTAQRPQRNS